MKKLLTLCALWLSFAIVPIQAQTFPDRPIKFIVPNPPGGSNDGAARMLATALSELWPRGIVIENRAGAGGNVGTHAAATSPADGYTYLLTSPGPLTINTFLYKKLPFDPQKDFIPIALVAVVPIVLIVNPKLPVTSVQELVALTKRETDRMSFASSGMGSTHHLAAELFNKITNVRLSHIPYRGAAPAMNDLIAGHVPILFDNLPTVIPHVESGTVRALAVASPQRLSLLPNIPTFAEAGFPGFEASSWFGLFAPAGTPPDIVQKLLAAVRAAAKDDGMPQSLEKAGALPPEEQTPQQFTAMMSERLALYKDLIDRAGIRPE